MPKIATPTKSKLKFKVAVLEEYAINVSPTKQSMVKRPIENRVPNLSITKPAAKENGIAVIEYTVGM